MVFDPQGKQVAISYLEEGKFAIVQVAQPSPGEILTKQLGFRVRLMSFTNDGRQIMLVGVPLPENGVVSGDLNPKLQALLLDAKTLNVEWRKDLPDVKEGFFGSSDFSKPEENFYYMAGMAADPANQRIYIAHADSASLTTVDFKTLRSVTVEIHDKRTALEKVLDFVLSIGIQPVQAKAGNSYLRNALLSSDQRVLYVAGQSSQMVKKEGGEWEMNQSYLPFEAWDIESSTRLISLKTEASELFQSTDGRILLKGYDLTSPNALPFIEIFNPADGRITAHLNGASIYRTLSLTGHPVLVSAYSSDRGGTTLGVFNEITQALNPTWMID